MSIYSTRAKRRVGYNVERTVAPAKDLPPAIPLPRDVPAVADVTLRGRDT